MVYSAEQWDRRASALLKLLVATFENEWTFEGGPHSGFPGYHAVFWKRPLDSEDGEDDDGNTRYRDSWDDAAHGWTLAEAITCAYAKALGEPYTVYDSGEFTEDAASVKGVEQAAIVAAVRMAPHQPLQGSYANLEEFLQVYLGGENPVKGRLLSCEDRPSKSGSKSASYPVS